MKKVVNWLIWVGVIASIIFIMAWILSFWDSSFSGDPADWGVFGDYIGGTLATILAAGSFFGLLYSVIQQRHAMEHEWVLRNDESYAKQAVVCLERAFNRVKPNPNQSTPSRDRLLWLECARLIVSAEELSKKIKSDGYSAMYESEREHWRGQFRDLFNPDEKFERSMQPSFFKEGEHGDALEHNSVYVIYEFMTWQDDRPDPMGLVNYVWDLKRISQTYFGAREYLREFQEKPKNK